MFRAELPTATWFHQLRHGPEIIHVEEQIHAVVAVAK